MKLLLRISFVGTNYNGYQVQPDKPTVQGELNLAAKRIFGFDCDIVGCSRTDSGVHANEFFVCVSEKGKNSLDCTIPMLNVPLAFNSVLPDDISVLEGKMVESDFHPRYDVKYKEYIYRIWNNPIKNPFCANRAYHIPQSYSDETVEKMNNGITEKDFTEAKQAFGTILAYENSKELSEACSKKAVAIKKETIYKEAVNIMNSRSFNRLSNYNKAIEKFNSIKDYEDVEKMINLYIENYYLEKID